MIIGQRRRCCAAWRNSCEYPRYIGGKARNNQSEGNLPGDATLPWLRSNPLRPSVPDPSRLARDMPRAAWRFVAESATPCPGPCHAFTLSLSRIVRHNCPRFQRESLLCVCVYIKRGRIFFTSSLNLSLSFCSTPSSPLFYLFFLPSLSHSPFVPREQVEEEGSFLFLYLSSSIHLPLSLTLCFLRFSLSLSLFLRSTFLPPSLPPSLSTSLALSKLSLPLPLAPALPVSCT